MGWRKRENIRGGYSSWTDCLFLPLRPSPSAIILMEVSIPPSALLLIIVNTLPIHHSPCSESFTEAAVPLSDCFHGTSPPPLLCLITFTGSPHSYNIVALQFITPTYHLLQEDAVDQYNTVFYSCSLWVRKVSFPISLKVKTSNDYYSLKWISAINLKF